ncbi:class I SAM-dependent methyltransferase [Agilicoccus flavus]|uniref:class I SAM-dependent methyltransferase n=1 Tax=Agilicoccus flavus TaxID=2775968 RepID=UPI001CF633F2|nr:class I SAM-dependent methyltransferase [Agilicoccus flavus]
MTALRPPSRVRPGSSAPAEPRPGRASAPGRITVGDIITTLTDGDLPFRVTAYDGSDVGPADADITMRFENERALRYVLTAPGDLGVARAYLQDDLTLSGVHPGDPYEIFRRIKLETPLRRPSAAELARLARGLGWRSFTPPPPPQIETLPRWRRHAESLRESSTRRAAAISHHYDVSNAFYELVLGPSMAYTCAVFASPQESLETAQERKFELVATKLALQPGMRLLDVGCGWGSMVRHAAKHHGVRALGVTLSKQQADWAQAAIERDGLSHLAEVRYMDYRDAPLEAFDAISSIGLTEHIGVRHYPQYFSDLFDRLRPGGRLLNHTITRTDDRASAKPQAFTDRYVFPDGELAAPGLLARRGHNAGFELQHEENLRMSYAYTLRDWCADLVENWDACVAEVGERTARVWGLYMAGSRMAFEVNWLQLHQFLFSKPGPDGAPLFPLRPDWDANV